MSLEQLLPVIFMLLIGLSLLIYSLLDGYDLGMGMLLPFANESEKDTMMASIGPFWDANETWIVLGIGVLMIAFPEAYGIILTTLYLPTTLMLMGLILRGAAYEFRIKSSPDRKHLWNQLFTIGSILTAVAQGWMLGIYITGLQYDSSVNLLFAILIAICLPAFYLLLGVSWLIIKTEGSLQTKAFKWGRIVVWPMGLGLLMISIATPLVSESIAERWFTLPNFIGLLPIPIVCVLAYASIQWLLHNENVLKQARFSWLLFLMIALICVVSLIGLSYGIYPYIIIDRLTIFSAASATNSLLFVLVGILLVLPMIIGYTIYIYSIFAGKTSEVGGMDH